jgi:SAM-dependent methyltransferase
MLLHLARRSSEPELMDATDTDYGTFRDCLRDLARVNVLSKGYHPTLAFLEGLHRHGRLSTGRPIRVLDVGSGYGDLLRVVDRWAVGQGIEMVLTGLDLSPWSARAAREATEEGRPIEWATGDVFAHSGEADIVVSSLFAHHLDDAGVIRFLRWMEDRARLGWMVNDLHRHVLPYATFGPLASALRFHRFVRHDGPVSFARAFVAQDWEAFVARAGIPANQVEIRRWFPFRLCVSRVRSD